MSSFFVAGRSLPTSADLQIIPDVLDLAGPLGAEVVLLPVHQVGGRLHLMPHIFKGLGHEMNLNIYRNALQMKGLWESNINVCFPFMYSQKWNCYFQNRIIIFCLPVPTLVYLWEIYIFPGSVCLFCCRKIKYVDRSLIYKSLTDTWMWKLRLRGRAIPRKGIHKGDFRCSMHVLFMNLYWFLNFQYEHLMSCRQFSFLPQLRWKHGVRCSIYWKYDACRIFVQSSQQFGAFCLFLLVRGGGGGISYFLLVHCSGKLSGRTADNF